MPILRFRVYLEEDDQIYRDIELMTGQTLLQFHEAINKSYEFDGKHTAVFFESNDRWDRGRAFSSEVLTNKKDAPTLSMVKTPVSALVSDPGQKFVYEFDPIKKWTFLVELIGVSKDENPKKTYPCMVRKEGLGPPQYGIKGLPGEQMMEVEEAYDLDAEEMAEGFGNEGEDGGSEESFAEDLGGGDE